MSCHLADNRLGREGGPKTMDIITRTCQNVKQILLSWFFFFFNSVENYSVELNLNMYCGGGVVDIMATEMNIKYKQFSLEIYYT